MTPKPTVLLLSLTLALTLHRKSAGTPDSEGWYPAISTGCGFSVLLPTPYDDFTSSAIDPAGEVLERHVLSSTTADGARFSVACMESKALADPFIYPEQYVLNIAAGDRILRKVAITLGNLSGLEVSVMKGDGGSIDARVLVDEERVYELMVEYPAPTRQAASLARDAVFSSFTPSRLPSTPNAPDAGAGQPVVARIASLEPKSYTDHFDDWSVLVSDVFVLAVLEPPELAGITVHAYYQGRPVLDGHVLSVGDVVGFQLPSRVKRSGVLLWDLQELRLLRPSSQQPKAGFGR